MSTAQEAKARGVSAYREQDWALAVECFQRAIDNADETDELHLYYSNRSASLMQCGRIDEAIADAEACTQINPCFAKGWSRLGAGLLRKGGQRSRAIAAMEKAVELEPTNPDARAALARARPPVLAEQDMGCRVCSVQPRRSSPEYEHRAGSGRARRVALCIGLARIAASSPWPCSCSS